MTHTEPEANMEPELPPCPFCGGDARVESSEGAFYVACDNCAATSPVLPGNGAIAAWCGRSQPDLSSDALVEELAVIIEGALTRHGVPDYKFEGTYDDALAILSLLRREASKCDYALATYREKRNV